MMEFPKAAVIGVIGDAELFLMITCSMASISPDASMRSRNRSQTTGRRDRYGSLGRSITAAD